MKTVTFTQEEIAALRIEFFPRMLVASVVASSPVAARALYKLDSRVLPWTTRMEVEAGL